MGKLVEMIGNGDVAHFQKQAAHRIWEGDVVEAARKVVNCKVSYQSKPKITHWMALPPPPTTEK